MLRQSFTICALLLSLLLGGGTALGADGEIYRSTDAKGNVIFTDQPSDTAKPVKVAPTNTMPEVSGQVAPAVKGPEQLIPGAIPVQPAFAYTRLELLEPASGETAIAVNGLLRMNIALEPLLQAGHSLRLLLDGAPAGEPVVGEFLLPAVTRGTHTLEVQVIDDDNGSVLQSTGSMEVQVLRPGRGGIGGMRPG